MQRAHSKSRRAESNRGQLGRSTLTVAEKATGSILGFLNPKSKSALWQSRTLGWSCQARHHARNCARVSCDPSA